MAKLIYLMSPYSAPTPEQREARFEEACRAAAWMMNMGFVVFSPIAHSHPIAVRHDLPKGWEFWRSQDETFVEHADAGAVLLLDGWRESTGVQDELRMFREQGKVLFGIKPVGPHYALGALDEMVEAGQ